MTSISHYPHSLNTKYYAVLLYRNGNPISFVCRRYKCSKASLMRWNKKFDGTKESLIDKSHKPLSPHPNAHTEQELTWIKNYIRRNPNISLCELYGKLRVEKGYSRHACSLFRIVRTTENNSIKIVEAEKLESSITYWQIDKVGLKCFNITDEEISKTHKVSNKYGYPSCEETKNNYYFKENKVVKENQNLRNKVKTIVNNIGKEELLEIRA